MTPSELKYLTRDTEPFFFTRKTMKFFGDTMKNYGVSSVTVSGQKMWKLYRKKPVIAGMQHPAFFDKQTLKLVFPELYKTKK